MIRYLSGCKAKRLETHPHPLLGLMLTHRMGLAQVRPALDLMARGEALKILIEP